MMQIPEIPVRDTELIKAYCQYALELHDDIHAYLTSLHGQTPSAFLLEETFKGALRPLVFVADQLKKVPVTKDRMIVDSSKAKTESESTGKKEIDPEANWLKAMAKKYDLDITNPGRVRLKRKTPEESAYANLLSKMTKHGYAESDGDFVLMESWKK